MKWVCHYFFHTPPALHPPPICRLSALRSPPCRYLDNCEISIPEVVSAVFDSHRDAAVSEFMFRVLVHRTSETALLSELTALDWSNTGLAALCKDEMTKFTALQTLNLAGNAIDDTQILNCGLEQLPIVSLDVSGNQVRCQPTMAPLSLAYAVNVVLCTSSLLHEIIPRCFVVDQEHAHLSYSCSAASAAPFSERRQQPRVPNQHPRKPDRILGVAAVHAI